MQSRNQTRAALKREWKQATKGRDSHNPSAEQLGRPEPMLLGININRPEHEQNPGGGDRVTLRVTAGCDTGPVDVPISDGAYIHGTLYVAEPETWSKEDDPGDHPRTPE